MTRHIFTKGFTLIELLVVITIIGVLAAVVIGSLNDARDEGMSSKIKAELLALSKRAAVEESQTFSFNSVCGSNSVATSSEIAFILGSVANFSPEPVVCNSDNSAYAVSAAIIGGTYWCVDSLNNSKEILAPLDPSVPELVCP
jgi:prepilin-type N-terminal cleavage/methylation domain-containing protein